MLTVAVARSFFDRVAIRYVLPVLWMTSFPIMAPWRVMCIEAAIMNDDHNSGDYSQILLNDEVVVR